MIGHFLKIYYVFIVDRTLAAQLGNCTECTHRLIRCHICCHSRPRCCAIVFNIGFLVTSKCSCSRFRSWANKSSKSVRDYTVLFLSRLRFRAILRRWQSRCRWVLGAVSDDFGRHRADLDDVTNTLVRPDVQCVIYRYGRSRRWCQRRGIFRGRRRYFCYRW